MTDKDAQDIFEMRNDPRMIEFTDSSLDKNIEETKSYIVKMNGGVEKGQWIIWAIEHKQAKKVIGSISIWNFNFDQKSGELGYGIIPDYQNKGLMKEALLSVIQYGFKELVLNAIEAYTEENNISSIKLLEKCQFNAVNKVSEEGYFSDRTYHMIVYRLENDVNI